jgi:hypothetical protein
MRIGAMVYDTWWHWRLGKIVKLTKNRWTRVRWSDGVIWNYDKSHAELFLRPYKRYLPREKRGMKPPHR